MGKTGRRRNLSRIRKITSAAAAEYRHLGLAEDHSVRERGFSPSSADYSAAVGPGDS